MNSHVILRIALITALAAGYIPARSQSWTSNGPLGGEDINCMARATNPDYIYAATIDGILKSSDGGQTWSRTSFPDLNVLAVAVAPEVPVPIITFDDLTAPCVFSEAIALSDEYEAFGVIFEGPAAGSGPAVLNDCSGFSITGYSPPNFLAVHEDSLLNNGQPASGPITIRFANPVSLVKINVASEASPTTWAYMDAYDSEDYLVHHNSRILTSSAAPLSVFGSAIVRVEIGFDGDYKDSLHVLDDLAFVWDQSGQADIVYAGTRRNGIYRSLNGGDSWSWLGLDTQTVNAVAISPDDPNMVFIGTGEAGYVYTGEITGIFKSFDGGENWIFKDSGGFTQVNAFLFDARDASHIYAGVDVSGFDGGFLKSTDAGESWRDIRVRTISGEDVTALTMTPARAWFPAVYATVRYDDIYKSTDDGETWEPTDAPVASPALALDPTMLKIYAGKYRSRDGAQTWELKDVGLPSNNPKCITIDPRNSGLFLGFSDLGGVYKSVDEAETWTWLCQGMNNAWIRKIAVHPLSPDTVYAAVRGYGYPLARSVDGGATWEYLANSPHNAGAVAIDPQSPATIYAGDGWDIENAIYVHRSNDGGETWAKSMLFYMDVFEYICVTDLWVSPDYPQTVIATVGGFTNTVPMAAGLWYSSDYGIHWDQKFQTWASCLTQHPLHTNVLYFGSKDWGYVYQSESAGFFWSLFSPSGYWADDIRDLAVDRDSSVYAAVYGSLRKWNGSAWDTLDNLPADDITALAIDTSASPGRLYIGTRSNGIYLSNDGGLNWADFNNGLENLSIITLTVNSASPRTAYAGTESGVWVRALETDICADANGDDAVNIGDPVYLINYVFKFGPAPDPLCVGDANGDGSVNIGDAVYIINYVFKSGNPPIEPCCP